MVVEHRDVSSIFKQRMRLAEEGRHLTRVLQLDIDGLVYSVSCHRPAACLQLRSPHRPYQAVVFFWKAESRDDVIRSAG